MRDSLKIKFNDSELPRSSIATRPISPPVPPVVVVWVRIVPAIVPPAIVVPVIAVRVVIVSTCVASHSVGVISIHVLTANRAQTSHDVELINF